MRLADLAGQRIAIWGFGREGRAALAALQRRLPDQPLTIFCRPAEAVDVVQVGDRAMRSVPRVVTEPPDAGDLSAFDVVIKSPGISAYKSPVPEAELAGVRFTSGTAIWFGERPDARVIAVTGTKGKSTTSAMIAHIARALGVRTALAGNIGMPLLDLVEGEAELWVVELSSFQTGEAGRVDIGVVTNLYQEHLDWHGNYECYTADKLKLADAAETLIVNATQDELMSRTSAYPHRVLYGDMPGWHVDGDVLCRGDQAICPLAESLNVPGVHNAMNACAALTALETAGICGESNALEAAHALAGFRGLPHRLQLLETRDGLRWIDDSISTTPAATLAALRSLADQAITAIIGGHDRGVDWLPFARAVASRRALHIVTQGQNGSRIAQHLRDAHFRGPLDTTDRLADAIVLARHATSVDGCILLSPGAPSFDQFRDYAERGCEFARLAGAIVRQNSAIEGLGIA